eukprot:GHUV01020188.1.p1 GENE.GHUV01020188.1~~GHUV01020188.1.p1  ORF type:complete len:126 (+),score=33.24 GHUV01020188.1:139-516(+)
MNQLMQQGNLLRRPCPVTQRQACFRPCRPFAPQQHHSSRAVRLQRVRAADAGTLGDMGGSEEPAYEYKPFSRLRERNPYRLLGVSKEASFEEIQDARNYLYEQYKWHEPSREAIEMAFDKLLQVR